MKPALSSERIPAQGVSGTCQRLGGGSANAGGESGTQKGVGTRMAIVWSTQNSRRQLQLYR